MENIEKEAISTYTQNLEFLKIHDKELFDRVNNLSYFIESNEYKERYNLEYIEDDKEFDIYDTVSDSYLYNRKPKSFIIDAVKNTNFDKSNSIMLLDDRFYNNKLKINIPEDFDFAYSGDPYVMNQMQEYAVIFNRSTLDNTKKFINIKKFLFIGTLLGSHILPINNKIKADTYFISESNIEIFRLSLFVTNYKRLSQKCNLIFSIMDDKNQFLKKIEQYYQYYFPSNYIMKYYSSNYNIQDYFDRILDFISLNNHYFYSYPAILNKISNSLENMRNYNTLNTNEKHNVLNDKKVLLLAAGPSLDKNILWLKENKDNFFIVSISGIISKLIKNNIIPDLIISADAKAVVVNDFPDDIKDRYKDIPTLLVHATNKIVINQFNKDNLYLYEIMTNIKKNSLLMGGASVSEQALQLLYILGAKDIYLLGVDLSYDSDTGESHTSEYTTGTKVNISQKSYSENNFMEENSYSNASTVGVKGNFKDKVITNMIFMKSIYGINGVINKIVQNNDGVNIYNLSDGAYFNHTIPMKINDIKTTYHSKENINKKIKEISSSDFDIDEIRKLKDSISFFNKIIDNLEKIDKIKVKTYAEFIIQREYLFDLISNESLQYEYISAHRILLNYVLISEPYLEYSFNEDIKNEANIVKKVKKVWINQIKELCEKYKSILNKIN